MSYFLFLCKTICLLLILFLLPFETTANGGERPQLFTEASAGFGIYVPLIKGNRIPYSTGLSYGVSCANFYTHSIGFRGGLNYVQHTLEDGNGTVSVPLYIAYRSNIYRGITVSSWTDSFGNFLFQVVTGLIPRSFELNVGINPGYIISEGVESHRSYLHDTYYPHTYIINSKFRSTLEAGIRINMKIWRFSFVINPVVAYSITNNYSFQSVYEDHPDNGLVPRWFFNGKFGLSYHF